ncbi:hypothetical protein P170DRAFT_109624 [Aspergillus steynii IBT 23096]|uniref:Uncharacterized protein n=1 Tax=Aspergillus steynii IBT 23096 TaxID=1392250 RepID=A0A2I2GIF9_9EURO|nr:uncharacterized protein P170DRAFT_109624 [Aspergillus steynii IBT 23096]PLB52665.1 hypothetical protein P170DRAFT_109624 [Aspergillus steynii IBT 23096]
MEKSPRPPNANPSSLLWAHQIRREHIHLVNQIDTLTTDLAVATDTMDDLQQKIETLTRQMEANTQCIARFQEEFFRLESWMDGQFQTILAHIDNLKAHNGDLETRIAALALEHMRGHEPNPINTASLRPVELQTNSPAGQSMGLDITCEVGMFKRVRTRRNLVDMDQNAGTRTRPNDSTCSSFGLTDAGFLQNPFPDSQARRSSHPTPCPPTSPRLYPPRARRIPCPCSLRRRRVPLIFPETQRGRIRAAETRRVMAVPTKG